MEGKSYTINFQVCGKKFRSTVKANSRQEAENRIREKIIESIQIPEKDPYWIRELQKQIDLYRPQIDSFYNLLQKFTFK